jgi:16S rRNA (uracil1498-N3)-methyltransferase
LPQEEAIHLTRVLRLGVGGRIRIFNGLGDEWDASIEDANKQHVVVRVLGRVTAAAEPRVAIRLAPAVLKGDKMDDVVRDAVMLGVVAIHPLVSRRTETALSTISRSDRVARWQRVAVASAKQCGRAVVPLVHPAAAFEQVVASSEALVMLVEPSSADGVIALRDVTPRDRLTLAVGPEGGWTPEELQRGRESGAMLLTLGGPTLRADAVPVVALTALRVHLEDF